MAIVVASGRARAFVRRAAQTLASIVEERRTLVTVGATGGLVLVLLFSTVFTFFASTATTAYADRAAFERLLSIRYVNVRYAFADERSLERKYQLSPSQSVAVAHRNVEDDIERMLYDLAASAPAPNASEALYLAKLHSRYMVDARSVFEAVDAGEIQRAAFVDRFRIEPSYSILEGRTLFRLLEQREKTTSAVFDLDRTQSAVVRIALILSLLGLASLVGFLWVIAAYRHLILSAHADAVRVMKEASLEDSLTRIGNHRAFKVDIERELSVALRHGYALTLAVLDIDEFKIINDQNGHVHGDRVLVELAEILRSCRSGDRVYRVGGDEFAILLSHTSATDARALLERIRSTFAEAAHGGTVSIGYATTGGNPITAETLQHQADAALYKTKRGGRNGVSCYDVAGKGSWLLSAERVGNLRALLASDSLDVAFQAIWDIDRSEVLAYEALARPPASFGFASPQDAFDLAERIGSAHALDRASRHAALRHAAALPSDALLFLNFSPQTLDRDFDIAEFVRAVETAGLRPERIVIEITEHAIAHLETVIASALALRAEGFGIALDDTGAGHAGLEIMSKLRFDYVKIDRAIIVKALHDRSAAGVVAAIVAFARITGAYVIAEGIENVEMFEFIERSSRPVSERGRGIAGAQGFLLHRPSKTFPSPGEIRAVRDMLATLAGDGDGELRASAVG